MSASSLGDMATQATFIFRGRVERLGATAMAAAPAADDVGVVTVEEVLAGPTVLGNLTSREVTIQFAAGTPQTASQAIFFTRPWLVGDGLAVVEVGRTEVGGEASDETARVRQEVADVIGGAPDRALQERLSEVDAVVSGRVVNVQPAPAPRRVSEHDPGLQTATIAVDSVEMGNVPRPTVEVLFASSLDVMWFQSPKLQVGREGIWLLQRGTAQAAIGVPAPAWTCLDPGDELPREEIDRVRNSVAAIGRHP